LAANIDLTSNDATQFSQNASRAASLERVYPMPDDHTSSPDPRPRRATEAERPGGRIGGERVRVLLPLPLPSALDYLAPEGSAPLEPGSFVRVPLGQRSLVGVVWDEPGDEFAVERLKPILETLPAPGLRPELCRFVERVAAYTMVPRGAVLRMTMSIPEALQASRPRRRCMISRAGLAALSEATNGRPLTPARRRVLELLRDRPPLSVGELSRLAGCRTGVVRDLLGAGLLDEHLAPPEPPDSAAPDWQSFGPALSTDQAAAARRLVAAVEQQQFAVTVLDGVTGSGKTETYFAAIAAALADDRQVLVLLPEIALGAQWLERFRARFGVAPAQWHSDVGRAERRDTWRAVATGRARVVVGARSALFLPFPELGLMVVD
jgi:primosomal protein N' (replication factor Y)